MSDPIDGGVRGTEPEESKDVVFLSTAHDVKEMFLGDPLDVGVEGTSVADCTSFVCSLVNVANGNWRGEFLSGEVMFSDELPVNAGDISTRVYQCGGVDNFEGM